ncbi:MAG: hypothetical protein ACP6IU_13030 [Candidatus Asgardarchaeia archaeon]
MAKLRGKKRFKRYKDPYLTLMSAEIKLDSLHQKSKFDPALRKYEEDIAFCLGAIRSVMAKFGHKQKTLKRWIKPAPNQIS